LWQGVCRCNFGPLICRGVAYVGNKNLVGNKNIDVPSAYGAERCA